MDFLSQSNLFYRENLSAFGESSSFNPSGDFLTNLFGSTRQSDPPGQQGGNPSLQGDPNSGVPVGSGLALLLVCSCIYLFITIKSKKMKLQLLTLFALFLVALPAKADEITLDTTCQVFATTSITINLKDFPDTKIPAACKTGLPAITSPGPTLGMATPAKGKITYTSTVATTDYFGTDAFAFTLACGTDNYTITVNLKILPEPNNIAPSDCFVSLLGTNWAVPAGTSPGTVYIYLPPLVGDLDGDGKPEIVTSAKYNTISNPVPGVTGWASQTITIFQGTNRDQSEFGTYRPYCGYQTGAFAIGKTKILDTTLGTEKDSAIIVVAEGDLRLRAYNRNGGLVWTSNANWTDLTLANASTAVGFADFNNDGYAEVYAGNSIFNAATGQLLCQGSGNKGRINRPIVNGDATMAADIDGDGRLELIAGSQVYQVTESGGSWSMAVLYQLDTSLLNRPECTDGWTQVADIDGDGYLDLIVENYSSTPRAFVYVWSPHKGTVLAQKYFDSGNEIISLMGVPFIGDIDGCGKPEILFIGGTGTGNMYIWAYKYDETNSLLNLFWKLSNTDGSLTTGLTLFDFNQDGIAEIVYRDEDQLRIINGSGQGTDYLGNTVAIHPTTKVLTNYNLVAPIQCSSGTGYEYPTIADIDGDGQAEILIGGNPTGKGANGALRIFKSGGEPWAPARPVWNQYMYNAVNVNDDLTIPKYQLNPATVFAGENKKMGDADDVRPYNAFLQQQTTINQYGVPFVHAADLAITSGLTYSFDPSGDLTITFTVTNVGEATMPPFSVSLYDGSIASANWLYTYTRSSSIAPGASVVVALEVTAGQLNTIEDMVINLNDLGNGTYANDECDTDNNVLAVPLYNDYYGLPYVVGSDYYFDFLKNDSEFLNETMDDVNMDASSVISANSATGAVVSITSIPGTTSGRNELHYIPAPGFFGIDVVQYSIEGQGSSYTSSGTVYIYIFEAMGRTCADDMEVFLNIEDKANKVTVNWFYPTTTTSADKIELPAYFPMNLDAKVMFNTTTMPIAAFNNNIPASCNVEVIPELMYWLPNTADNNWNNPDNWALDATGTPASDVPAPCTTVHIPGNAINYPILDLVHSPYTIKYSIPVCDSIIFHFGGEVAQPNLLNYNKAFIQYNVGYYGDPANYDATSINGDPLSAEPMNRSQWYGLAIPLKKVATGDFAFGGMPYTWQMNFLCKPLDADGWTTGYVGNFTVPFNTNGIELDSKFAYSYAFWANGQATGIGSDGKNNYQEGLQNTKGIIELPYFENDEVSGYHREHTFDRLTNISSFKYFMKDWDGLPWSGKEPGTIHRGGIKHEVEAYDAYRFIFDGNISQVPDDRAFGAGLDAFKIRVPGASKIMIGNPYLSSLDFTEFWTANKDSISDSYYLFEDEAFVAHPKSDTIAALQGFFIETTALADSVDLYFPFETVSVVRATAESHQFKSPGQGFKGFKDFKESEGLRVTATNKGKSNSATLWLNSENEKNIYKLFYPEAKLTPQIYFTDENNQKNEIQYLQDQDFEKVEIPLGIYARFGSRITLDFSGMEDIEVKSIFLLDKKTGMRQDLLNNSSYTFIQSDEKEYVDRFVLEIEKAATYIDTILSQSKLNIYQAEEILTVYSSEKIHSVELFDMQGRKVKQAGRIENNVYQMDLRRGVARNAPTGVYIVKAVLGNGEAQTHKIIVK
ncbi:hypothetical protein AGMMS50262_16890 [Bacteroidia bacterium]|nr:hypothetical protein AGMMS50262_16890 [Bacteroidia bacterium]